MLPERQLLDALGQGVIAIALDGSLVYANHAAERLFGWSAHDLIGRPVLELATPLPPETGIAVDEILDTLRAGGSWRGELSLTRRGGVPFLAGVVATPITDSDGELIAILALCDDLTDRRLVDEELSASRERLRLAMSSARMGTFRWDAATGLVEWDEPMEEVFGLEPGTFGGTFEAWIDLLHPDDREGAMEVVRNAVEERGDYVMEHRTIYADGSVHWIEGRGRALTDDAGRVLGTVGVAVDVTARKRTEQALRAQEETTRSLHELGLAFASELDLDLLVEAVTEAAVGATGAAYGAFFSNALDPHGVRFVLHAEAGAERFPLPDDSEIFTRTFAGAPVVRVEDLAGPGVRSYLAGSVSSRSGEVIGGLFLGHPDPGVFTDAHEALLVGIAGQAAVAIDNARLFAQQSEVAHTLQRSLLPPVLPEIGGVSLAARYHPAGAGLEVGGDFYDVFPVEDEWAVMIGDVSGTGAGAAALTAVVRHTARAVARHVRRPSAVIKAVNDAILALEGSEQFCTLAYGHLRAIAHGGGVELEIVSAGHPPGLVRRAGGTVDELQARGSILGQLREVEAVSMVVTLSPGDTLVLYTDGVTEARSEDGSFFGDRRLAEVLATTAGADAATTAAAIEAAVIEFGGGKAGDDIALLVGQAAAP